MNGRIHLYIRATRVICLSGQLDNDAEKRLIGPDDGSSRRGSKESTQYVNQGCMMNHVSISIFMIEFMNFA